MKQLVKSLNKTCVPKELKEIDHSKFYGACEENYNRKWFYVKTLHTDYIEIDWNAHCATDNINETDSLFNVLWECLDMNYSVYEFDTKEEMYNWLLK